MEQWGLCEHSQLATHRRAVHDSPPRERTAEQRLRQIELARRAVMVEGRGATDALARAWFEGHWIERSWRRCQASGRRPEQRLGFDMVAAQARQRVVDASRPLVQAAASCSL